MKAFNYKSFLKIGLFKCEEKDNPTIYLKFFNFFHCMHNSSPAEKPGEGRGLPKSMPTPKRYVKVSM